MRKGQLFLIAAVVIVSSVFIIKAGSYTPSIAEERRSFEVRLENSMFTNFATELKNSVHYSLFEGGSIITNVHDFSNFTKLKSSEHSLGFRIFFIGATANRTTSMLNVSTLNLLGESISVNLTLTPGTQSNATTISDYGRWDTGFDITPGNDYVLMATYNETMQNVSIDTKTNKDVFNSFFDITAIGDRSVHKEIYYRRYNIN
jgi:hypothetical protein